MFADNPMLGLGPGTWAARRVAYTDPGELDFITPHAHDVYLQTAAELGIVGLAVGVIALACVAWLAIGAIRGDRPERRRWAWAAVVALVYLGLHSVLDFYANMPAVLLLVAIPVAMLDATADRRLGLPARLAPLRRVDPRAGVRDVDRRLGDGDPRPRAERERRPGTPGGGRRGE